MIFTMRKSSELRQSRINLLTTARVRRLLETLTAKLTIRTGRRHTMTQTVELALAELAEREIGKTK